MKKADELKSEISDRFPVGTSRGTIEEFLKENKIEHSYATREKKIYAIIPNIGRYRLIYQTSLLIRIQFDEADKLKASEFELEHTGL